MKSICCLLTMFFFLSVNAQESKTNTVAFVADIHFLDIYADYENFDGIPLPGSNKKAKIRTMRSQLHSTRLFNENYFVLKAVLDHIAARGIKLVALPGDYTDDGQPINLEGLYKILKTYQDTHGIHFFITTGNHDPVRPTAIPGGKRDFLGSDGRNQPIFSESELFTPKQNENELITEPKLQMAGYKEIMSTLSRFGFFPQQDYLYWETPFSTYTRGTYSFEKAKKASALSNRMYQQTDSLSIPDASYLVEPVEGLWLLAIDGNTYLPNQLPRGIKPFGGANKNASLSGAGDGYNNAIDHKKHLFEWIKVVAKNAKTFNKKLVAFSHYPAVDFNEDASSELEEFLGKNKWQLNRVPEERIAERLAKAGIKIHFAGHMHINDTGKKSYNDDAFLVNIQTPSLAAYIPGYKILKITDTYAEVETITVKNVNGFDELFSLYRLEHDYLKGTGEKAWNDKILESKNYHDFTSYHLENLVELRFLPKDWSLEFSKFLSKLSGKELLLLANYTGKKTLDKFLDDKSLKANSEKKLSKTIKLETYDYWTGKDMILDFYKLRNADKLAFQDIEQERVEHYETIISKALKNSFLTNGKTKNAQKLYQFLSIFDKFLNGLPAHNFSINLETGEISEMK